MARRRKGIPILAILGVMVIALGIVQIIGNVELAANAVPIPDLDGDGNYEGPAEDGFDPDTYQYNPDDYTNEDWGDGGAPPAWIIDQRIENLSMFSRVAILSPVAPIVWLLIGGVLIVVSRLRGAL